MLELFKQSTTFNGDSWSLIDRGVFYRLKFSFKNVYLPCLQQKYLTILIILRWYKKKCSYFVEFLMVFWWCFSRTNLQLVFFEDINYVYLFLWCPLSSLKLLYDFCHLMAAWKYFTEAFLFLLYIRKSQVQEQSGCKLRFRCNRQNNDYWHW